VPPASFGSLVVVALIAVAAPMVVALVPRVRLLPSSWRSWPGWRWGRRGSAGCASRCPSSSSPEDGSAGLLQATSLPFIVTATEIGALLGRIRPVNRAALLGAA
jgi:hypothetical protein